MISGFGTLKTPFYPKAFTMTGTSDDGQVSYAQDGIRPTERPRSPAENSPDAAPDHSYSPLFLSQDPTPVPSTTEAPKAFAVLVPPVERPWEYVIYEDNSVDEVLKSVGSQGSKFLVRFHDERKFTVSDQLLLNPSSTHPRQNECRLQNQETIARLGCSIVSESPFILYANERFRTRVTLTH